MRVTCQAGKGTEQERRRESGVVTGGDHSLRGREWCVLLVLCVPSLMFLCYQHVCSVCQVGSMGQEVQGKKRQERQNRKSKCSR